jgi:hypothetical protein
MPTNARTGVWLRLDPRWDSLRDDPRFDALVRRMNYPA